jgi:antitoxin MazE
MYTSIQRWGNSNAIRLPKAILETVHITENDRVEILAEGDHILIQPVRRVPVSLEELFAGYEGGYDFAEQFSGSAGREVL